MQTKTMIRPTEVIIVCVLPLLLCLSRRPIERTAQSHDTAHRTAIHDGTSTLMSSTPAKQTIPALSRLLHGHLGHAAMSAQQWNTPREKEKKFRGRGKYTDLYTTVHCLHMYCGRHDLCARLNPFTIVEFQVLHTHLVYIALHTGYHQQPPPVAAIPCCMRCPSHLVFFFFLEEATYAVPTKYLHTQVGSLGNCR